MEDSIVRIRGYAIPLSVIRGITRSSYFKEGYQDARAGNPPQDLWNITVLNCQFYAWGRQFYCVYPDSSPYDWTDLLIKAFREDDLLM